MFHHITVLKEEATQALNIRQDGIYVDCTLGGAGHSSVIASQLGPEGRLIAFDQDDWALNNAREKLSAYEGKISLVKSNFRHLQDRLVPNWDCPKKTASRRSRVFCSIWVCPRPSSMRGNGDSATIMMRRLICGWIRVAR